MNNKPIVYIIVLITLLLGVLIGVLANDAVKSSNLSNINNDKVVDFNLITESRLNAYYESVLAMMKSGYDGKADFTDDFTITGTNAANFSSIFESEYGKKSVTALTQLFTLQMIDYLNYSISLKQNSVDHEAGFASTLQNDMGKLASFYSTLSPSINKKDLQTLFAKNNELLFESIQSYSNSKYNISFQKEYLIDSNTQSIAKLISTAIVNQFQTNFE